MRRKDREIADKKEISEIIQRAQVCHVAMSDNDVPYIVAMNFGFDEERSLLYFHSATSGKKLDILARNNLICFQFDIDHQLIGGDTACDWGMSFRSVVGMGRVSIVTTRQEKIEALNLIMNHYSGKKDYDYPEDQLAITNIIRVEITELTGKKKGY